MNKLGTSARCGAAWAALLAAFGGVGAGCNDEGLRGASTAEVVIRPKAFSFPKLAVGANADSTVTVTNQGDGELVITAVRAEYPQNGEFELYYRLPDGEETLTGIKRDGQDLFTYPIRIAGGQALDLVLNYRPIDEDGVGGAVVLVTTRGEHTIGVEIDDVGAEISVSPQTLDFGRVPAGERLTREIVVKNLGQVALSITEIVLNGSPDFTPQIGGNDPRRVPAVLEDPDGDGEPGLGPDKSFQIAVTYRPPVEGPDRGELLIRSSDPLSPQVSVNLTANGETPCLRVVPRALEFPASLVNRVDARQLTVESCGGEALTIHDIHMLESPDADAFAIDPESVPATPWELPAIDPGSPPPEGHRITVSFEPREQRIYNAVLAIVSNDPTGDPVVHEAGGEQIDAYLKKVGLLGRGVVNACPQARATQDEFYVRPLDVVELDGSPSIDQDGPGNKPVEYEWVMIDSPQGSAATVVEDFPNPADPGAGGLDDDTSTPQAKVWVDVAGTYTLELRVRDNLGLDSVQCQNPAIVTIVAQPEEAIHVQLTWRTPSDEDLTDGEGADLDLHLLHPRADDWFTTPYDCYYGNPTPDWGQLDNPSDDPIIDIDDINGGGPENVSLNDPESTQALGAPYLVGVHYYRNTGRVTGTEFGSSFAKVRIFLNGELAWDYTEENAESGERDPGEKEMQAQGDFWDVAEIHWPEGRVVKRDNYIPAP